MTSSKTFDAFLALVRLGIGHDNLYANLNWSVDWVAVKALAERQGLTAVVLDGADRLNTNSMNGLPVQQKLEWIGEVLQNYEMRYRQYEKAIGSLAGWYNMHGFRMMVLKGYACSLDWPKPEHRPCGDIDIWLFGKQIEADSALGSWLKVNSSWSGIDNSHHHHTVFEWGEFTVENHYDFINVHHHKSNVEFEKLLKQQGEDDSHYVDVSGERLYLPSPDLHALFLLKHTMMHFASEGIVLRQLLDWGFFVEKHHKEVDWKKVLEVLDQFGMRQMFNIINAICVGDLGFDVVFFPTLQFDPTLKEKVLNEILAPEYSNHTPSGIIRRVIFKIRRWTGNAWKHKLCYKETMWSAFWSGVWNHLQKPSSI